MGAPVQFAPRSFQANAQAQRSRLLGSDAQALAKRRDVLRPVPGYTLGLRQVAKPLKQFHSPRQAGQVIDPEQLLPHNTRQIYAVKEVDIRQGKLLPATYGLKRPRAANASKPLSRSRLAFALSASGVGRPPKNTSA